MVNCGPAPGRSRTLPDHIFHISFDVHTECWRSFCSVLLVRCFPTCQERKYFRHARQSRRSTLSITIVSFRLRTRHRDPVDSEQSNDSLLSPTRRRVRIRMCYINLFRNRSCSWKKAFVSFFSFLFLNCLKNLTARRRHWATIEFTRRNVLLRRNVFSRLNSIRTLRDSAKYILCTEK